MGTSPRNLQHLVRRITLFVHCKKIAFFCTNSRSRAPASVDKKRLFSAILVGDKIQSTNLHILLTLSRFRTLWRQNQNTKSIFLVFQVCQALPRQESHVYLSGIFSRQSLTNLSY